jgi:uncharacterized membrane protein (UPF0127 family)
MMIQRRLFLAGLSAFVAVPSFAQNAAGVTFEKGPLEILSGGKTHKFTVEFADNDQRRTLGLMYRRQMAADAGMLFDFKRDSPVAMWMRNTLIPLDMLFADKTGLIVHIHERAVPMDETTIESGGVVRAVLELNGGTVQRLGIKPGDRMVHAMFPKA